MGALVSALTTGLMVIVFLIAVFSLFVVATIPIGRLLQRRRAAAQTDVDGDSE